MHVSLKNRNKGDRQETAREEMIDELGNDKGGHIRIDLGARTAEMGDHLLPDETDDPAEQHGAHHDHRGDGERFFYG